MANIFFSSKRILILCFFLAYFTCSNGQYQRLTNPAYRYYARPGFVNTAELSWAKGIINTDDPNTKYYYGLTNVFGYQIDRNFLGGIGVGFYLFDESALFPVYLQYRYNVYLRKLTHFIYADGGVLFNLDDAYNSRIFINPGLGLSRLVSKKIEVQISAGLMIQGRSSFSDASFINFRIGIVYREESYRMFKAGGF